MDWMLWIKCSTLLFILFLTNRHPNDIAIDVKENNLMRKTCRFEEEKDHLFFGSNF